MREQLSFKNMRFLASVSAITVMVVSALLAFLMTSVITAFNIRNTVAEAQRRLAQSIRLLEESSELDENGVMSILNSEAYPLEWRNDAADWRLTAAQEQELEQGGMVYVQENILPLGETLVKADGGYWVISVNPESNQFLDTSLYLVMTLLFALAMSSILITYMSKHLMGPFRRLESAMQQVKKGDFTVQLPVRGDGEIARINANFNAMAGELAKVEMLRQDFVSNVSHEFKTPITSIHGFARLLQTTKLDGEQREYADVIAAESSRLSKLVTNILRLTRLESNERMGRGHVFPLDEQLRQCLVVLEGEWTKKDIEWSIDLDRVDMTGDEELLMQIWMNLIGNAIKFSRKGGAIGVRLSREDGDAKVVIEDEGIGMSEETQDHIFEKFYQGEQARSREGNGLGLSIVGRIVSMCEGKIEVWSREGEGARFTVRLPLNRSGGEGRE